jgi:hypothetical protein
MVRRNSPAFQFASSRSKLKAWPSPPGLAYLGRRDGCTQASATAARGGEYSAGRQGTVGDVPQGGQRLEWLGHVLGQAVRDVDAEPVDTTVRPEPQRGEEVVPDLPVLPVQVRLLGGEQVQVPLPVRHLGPSRTAETG